MRKFKAVIAMIMVMALITACSTESSDSGSTSTGGTTEVEASAQEMEPLIILCQSSTVKLGQIVQSQLKKAGMTSEIVEKKDTATFKEAIAAGQFDIYITGWRTGTGDADYALMPLFYSEGGSNLFGLSDAGIDEALLEGRVSKYGSDEFIEAYRKVEESLNENAYIVPLYSQQQFVAHSTDVTGVELPLTAPPMFNEISWTEESGKDNATDPIIMGYSRVNLTSFDPIKENNIQVAKINVNTYEGLVNVSLDNEEITEGLANAWYTEDQIDFYFVIREDAKFSDGSDITGEDIEYSLLRAGDKTVTGNVAHSVHDVYKEVTTVDYADVPESILANLEEEYGSTVENNTLIKISTEQPFSVLLNKLTHHTGGIVKKSAVENNPDYGMVDQAELLVSSGPYIVQELNKQTNELILVKNPYYYEPALAEQITLKIITESTASALALQAGDIQVTDNLPVTQIEKLGTEEGINVMVNDSVLIKYIAYNLGRGEGKATFDADLRKAIYYAINPEEILFIANSGYGDTPINSPLTPMLDTGYVRDEFNVDTAIEYLNTYLNK